MIHPQNDSFKLPVKHIGFSSVFEMDNSLVWKDYDKQDEKKQLQTTSADNNRAR